MGGKKVEDEDEKRRWSQRSLSQQSCINSALGRVAMAIHDSFRSFPRKCGGAAQGGGQQSRALPLASGTEHPAKTAEHSARLVAKRRGRSLWTQGLGHPRTSRRLCVLMKNRLVLSKHLYVAVPSVPPRLWHPGLVTLESHCQSICPPPESQSHRESPRTCEGGQGIGASINSG